MCTMHTIYINAERSVLILFTNKIIKKGSFHPTKKCAFCTFISLLDCPINDQFKCFCLNSSD